MARRIRGKNEGSIYKLENGTWRAQISIEGRRKSFTGKTQHECQTWVRQMLNQIDRGMTFGATKITLGDYLQDWMTSIRSSKRESTWVKYEQVIRMFVRPYIGQITVSSINPVVIQNLYNSLIKKGVGIPTIIKVHMVLHSAFHHAEKIGMINRNPASNAEPPKQVAKEMKILNESQVSQFLVTIMGNRLEALYHLALVSGARQMELLGLKWSDLNWANRSIRIERQLIRAKGTEVRFNSPKTRYGKRSISLGEKTLVILRQHYSRQKIEREKAGDSWVEHDLIFTNRFGGPIDHSNLVRDFKNLLRESGLPEMRFHDLRHTAASIMLNNGIPAIIVSRRLGHAKASITTDIYGHLIPGIQSEVGDTIDELICPIQLHRTAPENSPIEIAK